MSEMEHEPFHRGELAAQQRWRTADLWDTARKDRLLWDHIPGHLLARVEAAPFFFLPRVRRTEAATARSRAAVPA